MVAFSHYAVKLCIPICSTIQVSVTEAKYMVSVLFIFLKVFQYCSRRFVVLTVSLCLFGRRTDLQRVPYTVKHCLVVCVCVSVCVCERKKQTVIMSGGKMDLRQDQASVFIL